MKKAILTFATALLSAVVLFAGGPEINDVDIHLRLYPDGSGFFRETWDVDVTGSATEMYLPRYNLGDIGIYDFKVREGLTEFQPADWNVNWNRSQKARKCGINNVPEGNELCWGVGSNGPHTFELSYWMTNVVKSADDYDFFHMQIVNGQLSNPPEHFYATIEIVDSNDAVVQLDTNICKIWAFGYDGYIWIEEDGSVRMESDGALTDNSSVIALLRIKKGLINSDSKVEGPFQDHLDKALEGNTYFQQEEEEDFTKEDAFGIMAMLAALLAVIFGAKKLAPTTKNRSKSVLGLKSPEDTAWSREIPFSGDIIRTDTVLGDLCLLGRDNTQNVAQALILRMIYKGFLNVSKDAEGKDRFTFLKEFQKSELGPVGSLLYSLMKEAAGDDGILDSGEFSKWASRHSSKFGAWSTRIASEGASLLRQDGYRTSAFKYSEAGQSKARETYGFYRFLKDFTNMKDKAAMEAVLWQEYLVFGALFGIADKVARELKEIDPGLYEQASWTESDTRYDMLQMIRCAQMISTPVSQSAAAYAARRASSSTSFGGGGGHASFGGGGGFSGGGGGGGFR